MQLILSSAAATRQLGEQLGRALKSTARVPEVVGLNGDLGTGKTTFVAGVLAGMGVAGPVRSPTYTLIEPYEAGGRAIYHLDLYRLSGPSDLEGLGVRDLHDNDCTLLIEWAERGISALPPLDLLLEFAYLEGESGASSETPRQLKVTAHGPVGERLVALMAGEPQVRSHD
jgi:tRNA threonylcarbamoyladenosine biosynthesis protein TsaE